MSSDQTVDPQAVEQTKRQIKGLVDEIATLAKQDIRPEEFYTGFLGRVVEALAAVGGAVWILGEGNQFQLAYQINLRKASLDEPGEHQARHAKLLGQVVQNGEGLLVPPHSGGGDEGEGANPTEMLLVLAPMRSDRRIEGIVEIFQRPTANPATRRGYLRFLLQMCELAGEWLKSFKLQQFTDRELLWTQLDEFARAIHETLDLRQTAYTLANEAQRLIGCDRVSVAIRKGNRCKIEAVSGQDLFDTRSNVVTMLGKLATKVVATGEPLWYSGSTDDMPPQIEDAIHEYVDHSHAKTIAILPLLKPKLEAETEQVDVRDRQLLDEGTAVGALIVEQIEDVQSRDLLAPRVDLVTSHAARALSNATEHHNVFLLPLWRSIGRARWLVRARTLPKTLAVVFGVLFLVLALFLVPADFNLEGRGELQPVVQREVFADLDGEVRKVNVKHGDHVKEGDTLAVLENTDLEIRLDGVRGQLQQTRAQWQAASRRRRDRTLSQDERNRAAGEEQQLRQQLLDLKREFKLLSSQQDRLTVRSPIEGMVVTWNVNELLMRRPVNRGERLMTVADTSGGWELEVYMPENRMGHILKAQRDLGKDLKVEYIVATDPSQMLEGTVHEVDAITQLHGQQGDAIQSVRIRVEIDEADLDNPRPEATVTAKVYCGRRAIGYVWMHDVLEWFQSRVLFHL